MAIFSGTNLPPILRLLGSADAAFRIRHDTTTGLCSMRAPRFDLVLSSHTFEIPIKVKEVAPKRIGIKARRKVRRVK